MKTLIPFIILSLLLVFGGCSNGGNGPNDAGPDADAVDGGDTGPIPCTEIVNCPAKHLCLGGLCVPGSECAAEEDCPDGYSCNFMSGICMPEDQCESDAECTESSAPYCMTSAGLCVACHQDSHCSSKPDTPHCGPDWSCVACTDDPHCAGELICSEDNVCINPVGCEQNDDCHEPARPHCDTDDGQCYACLTDGHCAGSMVCEPGTRQCVACYQDVHCIGALKKCDVANFTCVGCLSDDDCLPEEHCNLSTNQCTDVFCQADSDCLDPYFSFCNTATGDCVECVINDHCGYYDWCRQFNCESDCLTDAECIEKYGDNQHCDLVSGDCFEAECMTDADCSGTPDKPYCKTSASPSNPPQYSCVECTLDEHCDEFFECSLVEFTCRVMPCYRYPEPHETCHQLDPCYYCDMGSGLCGPAYDCTYPDGTECCQGYTCNTMGHCERNTTCPGGSDLECPEDSTCNPTTLECEFQSCCDPPCSSGEYCTGGCECVSTCHELGEMCDPMSQNCCEGLKCGIFFPICSEI
jgi:hypothetical protein